jgi:hypothetical protein
MEETPTRNVAVAATADTTTVETAETTVKAVTTTEAASGTAKNGASQGPMTTIASRRMSSAKR